MKKSIAAMLTVLLCLALWSAAATDADVRYATVVTQRGPLNLRRDATRKADIIEKIPRDTIVTVTPVDEVWCKCTYQGTDGYIMTEFLSFLDSSQFQTLMVNDAGEDVLALKTKLQELYFFDADSKLDNQYDAGTETAVKLFEAAQGMEETGIATPALQALLHWGNPRNNLPVRDMTVTITCECSGYNHVGENWSRYYSINGKSVSSGDTLEVVLGEILTIYAKITEKDTSPDVGSAKEDVEISQEFYDNGFIVTQKISVRENKGRYAGNKAHWMVTYVFAP